MSLNSVSWANQAGLCQMFTLNNFDTAQIKSENCRPNLNGLQSCLHSLLSQILWQLLWENKKRTGQIIMLTSNFTTGSSTSLHDIKKKKKNVIKQSWPLHKLFSKSVFQYNRNAMLRSHTAVASEYVTKVCQYRHACQYRHQSVTWCQSSLASNVPA